MNKLLVTIVVGIVVLLGVSHVLPPVITLNHENDMAGPFQATGKGEVEVVPDIAQIDAGVQVNRVQTAEDAKNRISTVQNKVIEAMKGLGIDETDIKTTTFSITPEYTYDTSLRTMNSSTSAGATDAGTSTAMAAEPATQLVEPLPADQGSTSAGFPGKEGMTDNPQSRIVGYNGSANIQIKVRDTKKVSSVISAITKAGANQIGQVQFVVDDMDAIKDKARALAIADAKKRAKNIAKEAGIRLGKVQNVTDDMGYYPYAYDTMSAKAGGVAQQSVDPELAPGSQTVTAHVTIYYETK